MASSSEKKKLSRKEREARRKEREAKQEDYERVPMGEPLPPLTEEEELALGLPPTEEELARMATKWDEAVPHRAGLLGATVEEPLEDDDE